MKLNNAGYIMLLGAMLGLGACEETEYKLFDDVSRVQMDKENEEVRADFFYIDRSINRDTAYLKVNTIGGPMNRDRKISFQQITEYEYEYKYDEKGNPTDTITTEVKNKAVPGVHYVAMNDPEMQNLLVIPANEVAVEVPIILLRDASLRKEEVRLCLELQETEDFKLGESNRLSGVIIFADKLSKPIFWDSYVEAYEFGKYSARKHEFMYEVAGEKIDEEWYKRLYADMSESFYFRDKFKKALAEYNADEENIKAGLAPMREDQDDPNSPLITFP